MPRFPMRRVSRRQALAVIVASTVGVGLAACGGAAAAATSAESAPTAAPLDNLAEPLPALPEMRSGRSETFQTYTPTGRLDRIVYFADLPPGHVLNYYLDELPATGWTEESRGDLTARGGTLIFTKPVAHQRLTVDVEQIRLGASSTRLELETTDARSG